MSNSQKQKSVSHTPGPWAFEVGDQERGMMSEIFKADDPEFRIGFATCESHNKFQRAIDIQNARLIAAAPDLFPPPKTLSRSSPTGIS